MKKLSGSRMVFLYVTIVIVSVVSLVSALSLYSSIKNLLVEERGRKALGVSIAVAKIIEQDYTSFRKLLDVEDYEEGNYDWSYYIKMQQVFQEINVQSNVKFVYCGKRISPEEMVYLFDGESPGSKLFSPLGSGDDLDAIEKKVYSEKRPNYTSIVADSDWGELLTGVAPIRDPYTGEAVAHVGVDVSAEQIYSSLAGIKKLIVINAILFVIITSLIIYKLLSMNLFFMENDYLTGLHSKGYEERFLEQLIKKSTISGKSFPLIMIDFDDFKVINDEYGHHFGDCVLKQVADIIQVCTRSIDCCARYGGDEFIIVLPEANLEYASFVCHWLLKEVSKLSLITKDGRPVPVSISIGIALWKRGMTAEQILEQADKALYHSKGTGKGRMVIYREGFAQ